MTKLQHSAATAGFVVLAVFVAVPSRPHASRSVDVGGSIPDPPAYGAAAALAVGVFGLAARRKM